MNGIILTLLAIVPVDGGVIEERVDAIECNTLIDCDCKVVFDQLLFRRWNPTTQQFDILAWRLRKADWHTPTPDGGEFAVTFYDDDAVRCVRAPVLLVSGSERDQETVERSWLPVNYRAGLRPTRKDRMRIRGELQ